MGSAREPASRWTSRARWVAALCVGIVASILWTGCSVEKNYKTLSFFFDGVPDPNAVKAILAGEAKGPVNIRDSPTYTGHPPFINDQCSECHGRKRLSRNDSTICLKCHDKVPTEHERMHGPVAAAACMWCHHPHETPYAKLLREPAQRLCSQCHDATVLDSTRVPEHADAARSCLDCHFGHGGPQPYFLRPGPATPPGKEP